MTEARVIPGEAVITERTTGKRYGAVGVIRHVQPRGALVPTEPEIADTLKRLGEATRLRIKAEYKNKDRGPIVTRANRDGQRWLIECPRSDLKEIKRIAADLDRLDMASAEQYIAATKGG